MGGKFKSSVKKTFNQVHTSEQVKNELDLGFRKPCSVLLTPKKGKDCDRSYFLKIKEVFYNFELKFSKFLFHYSGDSTNSK